MRNRTVGRSCSLQALTLGSTIFLLVAGCGSESKLPSEPPGPELPSDLPAPALRISRATPANGAVIPGSSRVSVLLHYRTQREQGAVYVVVLCSKDGKLACVDAGKVADVARGEGDIEVAFNLRAPPGAQILVTIQLMVAGADHPEAEVSLRYSSE